MEIIAQLLIAVVALEHMYIFWMEMFAWETMGKKVFSAALPQELFKPTKGLAANQGLYNGFLAAGLFWSLMINEKPWQINIALFFLGCVALAGIYGGVSASKKIFFVQAVPAILGILAVLASAFK